MLWHIVREENDKLADVRISIGNKKEFGSYLVFRGKPEDVVSLLEESIKGAKKLLLTGDYEDIRGRPQG